MKQEFKVISYNVAGLPVAIDLNDLPWYLKPIAWCYKLIKKTTVIPLNTDGPGEEGTKLIGELLDKESPDIIGVLEDFNYHSKLMSTLFDTDKYIGSTFTGGLELKRFGELAHFYWNQLPTFRIDGLYMFFKRNRVLGLFEKIVKWNDHYGYFDHANDALMDKGFRHYIVNIDNALDLSVYDLHMDASWGNDSDEYNEDSLARLKLFLQLAEYINNTETTNPIIIMGDFNTPCKYKADKLNLTMFRQALADNLECRDSIEVCKEMAKEDLDKILYINNSKSKFTIIPVECSFLNTFRSNKGYLLSDHLPLMVEFKYSENN